MNRPPGMGGRKLSLLIDELRQRGVIFSPYRIGTGSLEYPGISIASTSAASGERLRRAWKYHPGPDNAIKVLLIGDEPESSKAQVSIEDLAKLVAGWIGETK